MASNDVEALVSVEGQEGSSIQEGSSTQENPEWSLPPPLTQPPEERATAPDTYTRVYFDLETTGGGTAAHITQISAVTSVEGDPTFDQYVLPCVPIAPYVSANITHQTLEGGQLCYNGQPVDALPLRQALDKFLAYLDTFKPCLLIAHDCITNDSRILTMCLTNTRMVDRFKRLCFGFSDSLRLFRLKFPERTEKNLKYSLSALFKDIICKEFEAHNSLKDSIALKEICTKTEVSDTEYMENSCSIPFIEHTNDYHYLKSLNMGSLSEMVSKRVISKPLAKTIASKGYNMELLQKAYDQNILDKVLKARVTTRESIILRIADHFKNGLPS